jgi:SAM-dependent methyltransferase
MPAFLAGETNVKRAYYGQPGVVERYLWLRYGGRGGANVARREKALFFACLGDPPPAGLIADLGCGPGRAAEWFAPRTLIGVDRSAAMLGAARAKYRWVVQADLMRLPFRPGVLALAFSLRVWFHLADPAPVAREVARSLRQGGRWIFEIYRWSFQPVGFARTGGRNYHYSPEEATRIGAIHGLAVEKVCSDFLLPPSFLRWTSFFSAFEERLARRMSFAGKMVHLLLAAKTS